MKVLQKRGEKRPLLQTKSHQKTKKTVTAAQKRRMTRIKEETERRKREQDERKKQKEKQKEILTVGLVVCCKK